jgi:heme exporter protein C
MAARSDRGLLGLWAASAATMPVALWAIFVQAPEERVMGAAQKIFYFHLPAVFATYAAVAVLLGASMAYLTTRNLRWDRLSRAATETGLLFCSVVLVTGTIWAKPIWQTWWTGEARLTTTLILWLLLVGCLMVRSYAENRELGARLAAIVGIVAALDIPIIHKAVTWWRGLHPIVFKAGSGGGLDPRMRPALGWSTLALLLLFALVLLLRDRLAGLEDRAALAAEARADGGRT